MKRNKGFTGVDIAVSVVIFTIFVTVIASMFYNLSVTENRIQRKTEATNLAIKVIETMKVIEFDKLTEGMTINDINNLITDKIEVPNGYNVTVGVDNSTYPDVIKIISVQIDYKSGKQDETINIETLVKKYTQIEITITYDANGGTGAPEAQKAYSDESITISTVEPTRDEYVFKGWSTSRNGNIDYKPGETVVFNADTRLYAVWGKIKKALIAMTSVTGFNVEHWHNVIVPHMKEYFNDAYPEIKITTVTGNEARQTLQELVVNNYEYEVIVLQNAVWEVPEIANELAKKYNLLTIGNDSTRFQKLDIAKSLGKTVQATAKEPSPIGTREQLALTSYGQSVLGNGLPPSTSDSLMVLTEFKEEEKILATATYDSPESNELYVDGVKSTVYPIKDIPVIAEWRNEETRKTWIHCQYSIGLNDNVEDYDLMVRLIKFIFGDV